MSSAAFTNREAVVRPCVGCGYCCKKAPCVLASTLGRVKDGKCQELLFSEGRYWCGLMLRAPDLDDHDEHWYKVALHAGAGCCSPMNSERRKFLTSDDGMSNVFNSDKVRIGG